MLCRKCQEEKATEEFVEMPGTTLKVRYKSGFYCKACFITVKSFDHIRYMESREHVERFIPQR